MTIRPMLANKAATARWANLCKDDRYFAEFKVDGDRLLVHIENGKVFPSSRTGKFLGVTKALLDEFAPFVDTGVDWVFDGEWMAATADVPVAVFWVFDVLVAAGDDFTHAVCSPGKCECTKYEDRRNVLENFYANWQPGPTVKLMPIARTTAEKRRMLALVERTHREGLIFKERQSAYYPGKRSDVFLKAKFRNTVDVVVTELGRGKNDKGDTKSNFVMALVKDRQAFEASLAVTGDWTALGPADLAKVIKLLVKEKVIGEVGECTANAGDGASVTVGAVVEVKCLYSSDDDKLIQATFPKLRHDKTAAECGWSQLDDCRTDKTVLESF